MVSACRLPPAACDANCQANCEARISRLAGPLPCGRFARRVAVEQGWGLGDRGFFHRIAPYPWNTTPIPSQGPEEMNPAKALRVSALASVACLALFPVARGNAAPEGGDGQPGMVPAGAYLELDVDDDGRVTEAEVLQDRAVKFQRLDANGDGAITLDEVRRMLNESIPSAAAERLKERGVDDLSLLFMDSLDENDDGEVQLVEFERPSRERFRQIDANSDGFVTPGEATFFFSGMRF